MRNDVIHVRVSDDLKSSVEGILNDLGITLSYAINMYLKQIEANRGIPFDVKLPNKEKELEIEQLIQSQFTEEKYKLSNYAQTVIGLYTQGIIDFETAFSALKRTYSS